MSKISTTWFYIIDNNFGETIQIEKDIYVSLFIHDIAHNISIDIGENSKVDVYAFFHTASPQNLRLIQNKNASKLQLKVLFISEKDLISNISSEIKANHVSSQIHIISIVKENHIGVDSSINIASESKKIQANLDLENIFIGQKWTLSSLPNLFIDSNDVQVSHSSKTHRIEENKLFYLKSRGLSTHSSIQLMTQSYFKKTFSCIEMIDHRLYKEIYENFYHEKSLS